jgi:hypothetical protein
MKATGRLRLAATATVVCVGTLGTSLVADHAWGTYHWARRTSPFTVTIVNSTTADWDPYVSRAVSDWSGSNVLDMTENAGGSTADRDRRQCNGPSGQVRICNMTYGQTGWLGIAGISIDPQGHITTGYTKLNDTYFAMSYYNTPAWKQSVTCQELGHNVGLGHQDEDFNNESLDSCMDYQDPPYASPDDHDMAQLATIYNHVDTYDSFVSSGGGGTCKGRKCPGAAVGIDNGSNPLGWGLSLGRRGQSETFMRIDPDGTRHIIHVTWAVGHGTDDGHEY